MKKSILVGMYLLVVISLHGMDQVDGKRNGALIRVGNGSIYDLDEKVDVLVVSLNKQLALRKDPVLFHHHGDVRRVGDNKIFTKFTIGPTPYVRGKEMKSTVIVVGEPKEFTEFELQEADSEWRNYKKEVLSEQLAKCYTNILTQTAQQVIPNNQNRTIAISLFGKSNVFSHEEVAPIAVKTIVDFLKNNPNSYALIHLLVKNDEMVKLCQNLLGENV